jgi:transcriptional regulator with XRE-family HTH domain
MRMTIRSRAEKASGFAHEIYDFAQVVVPIGVRSCGCAYTQTVAALEGLGRGLRRLRLDRAMTQVELADKAKMRAATVSDWERGATFPDKLGDILDGLGADLYDLAAAVDAERGGVPRLRPTREPQASSMGYAREALPGASDQELREYALAWEQFHEARERLHELGARRISAVT